MKKIRRLIVLLSSLLAASPVHAVAPLGPPSLEITSSRNQLFRAICDPATGTRIVEISSGKILWELPKWYRNVFLSDDGKLLVTAYEGGLINTEASPETVLLSFFKEGILVKDLKMKELIPDVTVLRHNMGYMDWGWPGGFNDEGLLLVRIGQREKAFFNAETGVIVRREKVTPKPEDIQKPRTTPLKEGDRVENGVILPPQQK